MADEQQYDPSVPKSWYDEFGEKEWSRLTFHCAGQLLFHVHMDVLKCYVSRNSSVLEIGAGAGFFTKELVPLAGRIVVSDISDRQLEINRKKMEDLGLANRIERFKSLDVTMLDGIDDASFDVVICVGGALNYTFEKAEAAVQEMLRVVKPGGIVVIGVISLVNSLIRFLPAVLAEKREFGIAATRWLFETGIQDEEHYPVANQHYLKMMNSKDLDSLLSEKDVDIIERRGAGIYSLAGEESLVNAREDAELWELILESEINLSKKGTCLDCGANTIYVVRKCVDA